MSMNRRQFFGSICVRAAAAALPLAFAPQVGNFQPVGETVWLAIESRVRDARRNSGWREWATFAADSALVLAGLKPIAYEGYVHEGGRLDTRVVYINRVVDRFDVPGDHWNIGCEVGVRRAFSAYLSATRVHKSYVAEVHVVEFSPTT